MAYPQYSNKNIESFNLNCIKSIAIFANVDCYTITLYNSIGFKKKMILIFNTFTK